MTLNLKPEERVGLGRKILQQDYSRQINFPGREPGWGSSRSWKLSNVWGLRKGARMFADNQVGPLEQDMDLWLRTLPGKSHGWRSLMDCSPWGRYESGTTERLHFHALEKEMATHSSVLAWRIPGMGEPGGLPSMGSHRVEHN